MQSIGMIPGSKLLEFKIIKGKEVPEIAKDMKVEDNESLYCIVRLRTGNDSDCFTIHIHSYKIY